jgi:hypothetical protein
VEPTGVIFAALDCDADAIEAWNRWYDLEHTPMNVCLDGVMLSRRYVAPPALHAARIVSDDSPFANGRATFLTTYVLAGDPQDAFDAMSVELPRLYDEGRMRFPAEKKTVREGGVFEAVAAVGRPELQLRPRDVPFVGHTGVIVVQRRGADRDGRAERIAELDGVNGVWTLRSRSRDDVFLDLVFVEDDPAGRAAAIRTAAPPGGDLLVDAPFALIEPLDYPWADEIRSSALPKTVA